MRKTIRAIFFGAAALVPSASAVARNNEPLPDWLRVPIAERKVSPKIEAIYEVMYVQPFVFGDEDRIASMRYFELLTGMEDYELLDENGKSICEYGGFAGKVRSGSCDPSWIEYVRTIYPTK